METDEANDDPFAYLITAAPSVQREAGVLRRLPVWREFRFDSAIFAPMSDDEMAEEGWP